jgi:hypothetical protein
MLDTAVPTLSRRWHGGYRIGEGPSLDSSYWIQERQRRPSVRVRAPQARQGLHFQPGHRRRELEAVAKRSGWEVVKVYQETPALAALRAGTALPIPSACAAAFVQESILKERSPHNVRPCVRKTEPLQDRPQLSSEPRAAIFARKEQPSDNRRSICPQARYRRCG